MKRNSSLKDIVIAKVSISLKVNGDSNVTTLKKNQKKKLVYLRKKQGQQWCECKIFTLTDT